jgi:hypothetical protein
MAEKAKKIKLSKITDFFPVPKTSSAVTLNLDIEVPDMQVPEVEVQEIEVPEMQIMQTNSEPQQKLLFTHPNQPMDIHNIPPQKKKTQNVFFQVCKH